MIDTVVQHLINNLCLIFLYFLKKNQKIFSEYPHF